MQVKFSELMAWVPNTLFEEVSMEYSVDRNNHTLTGLPLFQILQQLGFLRWCQFSDKLLKSISLGLSIAALTCNSMVAITKAPTKTDDRYFALSCSDGKKIPNVQYQVLAQSAVLKKLLITLNLKTKQFFCQISII